MSPSSSRHPPDPGPSGTDDQPSRPGETETFSTPPVRHTDLPEETMRGAVRTARHLFGVPIALLILQRAGRMTVAAQEGLTDYNPTPLLSLCERVMETDMPVCVEAWHRHGPTASPAGAFAGPRVEGGADGAPPETGDLFHLPPPPTVGDSRIRFYASAPLRVPNAGVIGCLSVFGYRPQRVSPSQRESLTHLAGVVSELLSTHHRASQFEAAFASPNILSWILAPDGTIEGINDAALDSVNAARGDIIGRKIWNGPWWRHDPHQRDNILQRVREAARRGTHQDFFAGTHLRSGGRIFTTRTTICPTRGRDGAVSGLLLFACETTAQHHRLERLERRRLAVSTHLHQAELDLLSARSRVDEANRELTSRTRMLATLSHEVRTPLTSVIGFANTIGSDLLALRSDGPPDGQTAADVLATLERFAHLIEQSGKRLLSTLDGVLTLSKLETGQLDLSPKMLDAGAEVRAVAAQLEPEAEKAGVALTVTSPDPLPVWADPDALQIVLRNLLSNALKYTEAGGTAQIRAAAISDGTVFVVEDTGIGMDPDEVPDLLQSFHRGTTPLVEEREGVGLGLSIVQQIVTEMNGTIDIDTAPGRGTTVTVRLLAPESTAGS